MTFLQSEITDHPARDKIRYSGILNFTDRPAHVKYAYLRASSGVDRRALGSEGSQSASGGGTGWRRAEMAVVGCLRSAFEMELAVFGPLRSDYRGFFQSDHISVAAISRPVWRLQSVLKRCWVDDGGSRLW